MNPEQMKILLHSIGPCVLVILLLVFGGSGCTPAIRTDNPVGDGAGLPEKKVGVLYGVGSLPLVPTPHVAVDGIALARHGESKDKKSLWYTSIKLLPGSHTVYVSFYFHGREWASKELSLDVKSGHRYKIKYDGCYWCSTFRYAIWIEDFVDNEVVAGSLPDWPSWML